MCNHNWPATGAVATRNDERDCNSNRELIDVGGSRDDTSTGPVVPVLPRGLDEIVPVA